MWNSAGTSGDTGRTGTGNVQFNEITPLVGASNSPGSSGKPLAKAGATGSTNSLASSFTDMHEEINEMLQTDGIVKDVPKPASRRFAKCAILLLSLATISIFLTFLVTSSIRGEGGGSDETDTGNKHRHQRNPQLDAFPPFSTKDPIIDLAIRPYNRSTDSSPADSIHQLQYLDDGTFSQAVPTNAWYQNMLMAYGEPSAAHRAYTCPYIIDTVGQVPGLRVHNAYIDAFDSVIQASFNELHAVTLGAAHQEWDNDDPPSDMSHAYNVTHATDLGFSLEWKEYGMTAPVVRGMPYTTVIYDHDHLASKTFPTLVTGVAMLSAPVIDQATEMQCSGNNPEAFQVDKEIELKFVQSDMTWLMFFSEPVLVKCHATLKEGNSVLQVVGKASSAPLVVRFALSTPCTDHRNPNTCRTGTYEDLAEVLRAHADIYPGSQTSVRYSFDNDSDDDNAANIYLDWDAQSMSNKGFADDSAIQVKQQDTSRSDEMLMFALPHHHDNLVEPAFEADENHLCRPSMLGPTCLVSGNVWNIREELPKLSFRAPRAPTPASIRLIGKALLTDIDFELPEFFMRGAGDTYFSGKMLAKLARILLVHEEVDEICKHHHKLRSDNLFAVPCHNTTLPSRKKVRAAFDRLKHGTQAWINGTAETPFVYDVQWGGFSSCGCMFRDGKCQDTGDACPGFTDHGLNFGNAFYNDQHFHYGYHIYAASVVAHFDPAWGRAHWEQVLLMIRSIANPSTDDPMFPLHRHKDWYQGSSWASGIPRPPYPNGKNQESSSEAIAGYEAVGLFGQVMRKAWHKKDNEKEAISTNIMNVGRLLTATEVRSAQRYWHVVQNDEALRIYPKQYTHKVVGIVWSTMAQFGTWFGNAGYLPYGIQLLPLTSISEQRDNLQWVNEMYDPLSRACGKDFKCTLDGWSFLSLAMLATVGHRDTAMVSLNELPAEAYESAGGNGHSKTNTLWYIATRPKVGKPVKMTEYDIRGQGEKRPAPSFVLTDCYRPGTCTDEVLDKSAGKYTCRERMQFLIDDLHNSQWGACATVAGIEFPNECGHCDPSLEDGKTQHANKTDTGPDGEPDFDNDSKMCPPCSKEQCSSDLNRCPASEHVFVCTEGSNTGGCSGHPWPTDQGNCNACCEMTECYKWKDEEAGKVGLDFDLSHCPPCEKSICYGNLNQCPIHDAPFLCMEGTSIGGCSSVPWDVTSVGADCASCCQVTIDC